MRARRSPRRCPSSRRIRRTKAPEPKRQLPPTKQCERHGNDEPSANLRNPEIPWGRDDVNTRRVKRLRYTLQRESNSFMTVRADFPSRWRVLVTLHGAQSERQAGLSAGESRSRQQACCGQDDRRTGDGSRRGIPSPSGSLGFIAKRRLQSPPTPGSGPSPKRRGGCRRA